MLVKRRWIEIGLVAVLALLWLNWRILRNLWISLRGVLYFPVWFATHPAAWYILAPIAVLVVAMFAVAFALDAWKAVRR